MRVGPASLYTPWGMLLSLWQPPATPGTTLTCPSTPAAEPAAAAPAAAGPRHHHRHGGPDFPPPWGELTAPVPGLPPTLFLPPS